MLRSICCILFSDVGKLPSTVALGVKTSNTCRDVYFFTWSKFLGFTQKPGCISPKAISKGRRDLPATFKVETASNPASKALKD